MIARTIRILSQHIQAPQSRFLVSHLLCYCCSRWLDTLFGMQLLRNFSTTSPSFDSFLITMRFGSSCSYFDHLFMNCVRQTTRLSFNIQSTSSFYRGQHDTMVDHNAFSYRVKQVTVELINLFFEKKALLFTKLCYAITIASSNARHDLIGAENRNRGMMHCIQLGTSSSCYRLLFWERSLSYEIQSVVAASRLEFRAIIALEVLYYLTIYSLTST